MNFSFGVYELFAYSLPGGLQLLILGYLVDRADWIDHAKILGLPTTFLVVGGFAASLFLGNLLYPPALSLVRGANRAIAAQERKKFRERHPLQANRPFVNARAEALAAAVSMAKPEARSEINTLAAQGLMLRNAVIPFIFAATVSVGELVASDQKALAASVFVASTASAVAARQGGLRYYRWQIRSTFNHAVWVPDVDRLGTPPT